jgi:hypothetical protein
MDVPSSASRALGTLTCIDNQYETRRMTILLWKLEVVTRMPMRQHSRTITIVKDKMLAEYEATLLETNDLLSTGPDVTRRS